MRLGIACLTIVSLNGCVTVDVGSLRGVLPARAAAPRSVTRLNAQAALALPTLPFESLYFISGAPDPQQVPVEDAFVVIRSVDEWEAFKAAHPYVLEAYLPPPPLDFSTHQWLAVALAAQPGEGTFVEIAAIEDKGDHLLATPIRWRPESDFGLRCAPYHIVSMARSPKPVRFAPLVEALRPERRCRLWPAWMPGGPPADSVACDPVDGAGIDARFGGPRNLLMAPDGSLYVVDGGIRRIDPDGRVTTLHRTSDRYSDTIFDLAFDDTGRLLVASQYALMRFERGQGLVPFVAGHQGLLEGQSAEDRLNYPYALANEASGSVLVLDGNNSIHRVSPAGQVTTLLGPGRKHQPTGIAVAPDGRFAISTLESVFIHAPSGELLDTIVGEPNLNTTPPARFSSPRDVGFDASGRLYVLDANPPAIWRQATDGVWSKLTGGSEGFADGQGASARLGTPAAIEVTPDGRVYVADAGNHRVRIVQPDGTVATLAGGMDTPHLIAN